MRISFYSCFNVKSSTYYFHMKRKILADFQIWISVPLTIFRKIVMSSLMTLFLGIFLTDFWISYFESDFKQFSKDFRRKMFCWFLFFFMGTVLCFWLIKKFQWDTFIHYKIRCIFRVFLYGQKMYGGWYIWVHIYFLICLQLPPLKFERSMLG